MDGQQINQIPKFSLLQEGENFTTYCNSSSTLYSFQWYKQRPGGSPVFLMLLTKPGEVKKPNRLTARFGDTGKDSSLHITAAQSADAGTYFCMETRNENFYFGRGTHLTVIPSKSKKIFHHWGVEQSLQIPGGNRQMSATLFLCF